MLEVPVVVQAGEIVGDGQFADLGHQQRVFDGNGGEIGDGREDAQVLVVELPFFKTVEQLDDAVHLIGGFQRHADHRAGCETDALVRFVAEARIFAHIGNQQRFAMLGDPACDPRPFWQTLPLQAVKLRRDDNDEFQFAACFVTYQQRPGFGAQQLADFFHGDLIDVFQRQMRRQRLADVDQGLQFVGESPLLRGDGARRFHGTPVRKMTFGFANLSAGAGEVNLSAEKCKTN